MHVLTSLRAVRHQADASLLKKRYDRFQAQGVTPQADSRPQTDLFVKRSSRVSFGTQVKSTVSPQEKLARMAEQLEKHQLDAYYIPPEDEHLNEYLPKRAQRIEWLSGFTGENTPLLVTRDKMHLYVNGIFHIQVDLEVSPDVVQACKLQNQGAETEIANTLKGMVLPKKTLKVGYDPFIVSPSKLNNLQKQLPPMIKLVPVTGNLADSTWTDRPSLPVEPAHALSPEITGVSTVDKLKQIREELKQKGADALPITKLDEVNWLFNLTGGDVHCNPVLLAYGLLTPQKAWLFAPAGKVSVQLEKQLASQGVTVRAYEDYPKVLTRLLSRKINKPSVLVDNASVTEGTLDIVRKYKARMVEDSTPITIAKAIKNPIELERMKLANFEASRAIIRHMAWIHQAFMIENRKDLSEAVVRDDLEAKYKEAKDYVDLSFPTIPGIGSNSAIIHYSHADSKNFGKEGSFYLLDSGIHITGGTTDTTRTTVFGKPKPDQVEKFTAVLKAHVDCASAKFPEGTNGVQLDAICRSPMWQDFLDFAHGTGHGVGAGYFVHQGPHRIAKVGGVPFKPGMVTSIEPGYYEKDWGGIRLENLYYVKEEPEHPKWFSFESLTLVPFEKKLIDFSKLNDREREWLNAYNRKVWDKMSPVLNDAENAWLKDQCTFPL